MDNLITCSVCLRRFEDPRVLPCQHTFCLRPCLEKIYETGLCKLKCPLCREDHFLTRGKVQNLPRNLTVCSILDLSTAATVDKTCAACDQKVDFVKPCECCAINVCRRCYEIHVEKTRESVAYLTTALKARLSSERSRLSRVQATLTQQERHKLDQLAGLDAAYASLKNLLEQRRAELVRQVGSVFEGSLNWLHGLRDTMELDTAVLASSLDALNQEKSVSLKELLELKSSIEHTLPPQQNNNCLLELPKPIKIDLSLNMIPVEKSLAEFGLLLSEENNQSSKDSTDNRKKTTKHSPANQQQPSSGDRVSNPQQQQVETAVLVPQARNSLPPESTAPREKTFILNRPARCVSYDIPASGEGIPLCRGLTRASRPYAERSLPVLVFGRRGSGPGEFIWPRGLAVDRSCRIIVADSSNHRLQIFDEDGQFVRCCSSMLLDPETAATGSKTTFDCVSGLASAGSRLVCSDRYNHRVVLIEEASTGSGGDRLLAEMGVQRGGDGDQDHSVGHPWGVAVARDGSVLVCDKDNHRIQVYSKLGQYRSSIGGHGSQNGMFKSPHYVAICPTSKRVFVSDTSNHRIQGNVIVCDSGNNRISVFGPDRKLVAMFGSHGSAEGQFKGLEGVAIVKRAGEYRIVVADRDNHRIQIF